MPLLRACTLLLVSAALSVFGTKPLKAEAEVDLALVLAVDVSRSMDVDEQRLQRDGYVGAFRSKSVHDAIRKGEVGRIAVIYIEWSGPQEQMIVVPWTVLRGADEAKICPVEPVASTSEAPPRSICKAISSSSSTRIACAAK